MNLNRSRTLRRQLNAEVARLAPGVFEATSYHGGEPLAVARNGSPRSALLELKALLAEGGYPIKLKARRRFLTKAATRG